MAWCWYHGSRDAVPRGMWQLLTHWQHPTCRKMCYRQEVPQRPRRWDDQVQCALRYSHVFFPVAVKTLGLLSDEAHSLIAEIGRRATLCTADRGKLRSCTNVFPWQFSVSTQCALPTRSQYPSPYRNHSGQTFLYLLILKPWEWSTGAKIIIIISKWYRRLLVSLRQLSVLSLVFLYA